MANGGLGRYDLLLLLATGGMGEVFLARQRFTVGSGARLVAIKRLLPKYGEDEPHLRMFLEEAHAIASVRHQNVAEFHDVEQSDDGYFMVMEYIAGDSLRALLDASDDSDAGCFPLRLAGGLFIDLAHALQAVHEAGLVHGDVTPSNVMISDAGVVKLIDFGVARPVTSGALAVPAALRGKLGYMAPEYLKGDSYDHRLDVFSLGVTMWETLTGRRLFVGATIAERLRLILASRVTRVDAIVPSVPPAIAELIARSLARDPDARFATASALAAALAEQVAQLPPDAHCSSLGDLLRARRRPHVEDRRTLQARFLASRGVEFGGIPLPGVYPGTNAGRLGRLLGGRKDIVSALPLQPPEGPCTTRRPAGDKRAEPGLTPSAQHGDAARRLLWYLAPLVVAVVATAVLWFIAVAPRHHLGATTRPSAGPAHERPAPPEDHD